MAVASLGGDSGAGVAALERGTAAVGGHSGVLCAAGVAVDGKAEGVAACAVA